MDAGLVIAISLAVAFAVTNGLHDAANAIATLVATRAATPLQAIVLASAFNLLGPFVVGAAVADTIGGIVEIGDSTEAIEVIGSGLAAAVAWNLITWRLGLPSSLQSRAGRGARRRCDRRGGIDAVNWGGIEDWRPVGVFGTLIALAICPVLGALAAFVVIRALGGSPGARRGAGAGRFAAGSGRCRRHSPSATAPTTRRRRSASSRRCCSPPAISTPSRRRPG